MRTTSCGRVVAGAVRVFLSVFFGAVVIAVAAPPAAAHTALKTTNPKSGARVTAPPSEITLEFTGPIRAPLTRVTVQGPGGAAFESGPPQVGSDTVAQPVRAFDTPGRYQIVYRVVAEDGHPLTGTIRFTVAGPAPDASGTATSSASSAPSAPASDAGTAVPSSATGDADDGGVSPWVISIGAIAALAFVTGVVWFGRRATRDLE
ncbi:MAG: copper resistance CopC family protein [Actinomadura sp.]